MNKSKYCSECGEAISLNAEICPKCGVRQQAGLEMKFCSSCGESILKQAEICPKCGVRQERPSDNVSAAVNPNLGKGFELPIFTFKELKKKEDQFDFSFFRCRRFGYIIVSTHQTCTSILGSSLRLIGGASKFFGSGKILFDKKIDINSITFINKIKNWDKYNLILGSIILAVGLLSCFVAGLGGIVGILLGALVIYNAQGMELSIIQNNGEKTSFQTWNLGDEKEFINELKKINPNIKESFENKNINLNNVFDNETVENLKEKYLKDVGFWKRNIGGIAVSLFIIIFICGKRFSEGNNSQAVLQIFVSPLSIFLGTIGWKIGNKFAECFAPDTIFYSHTSDLIKTRLFWKIVPQFIGALIGTFIPYVIFGYIIGMEID